MRCRFVICCFVLNAVISLWQIAVGGCEYTDPNDAGNLEFDWLEVQLKTFRSRGVKVSVSGA